MYCLCIFSLVFERESILSTSIILTSKDDDIFLRKFNCLSLKSLEKVTPKSFEISSLKLSVISCIAQIVLVNLSSLL